MFPPIFRLFTPKNGKIASWKSKEMLEENIKHPPVDGALIFSSNFDHQTICNYGQGR